MTATNNKAKLTAYPVTRAKNAIATAHHGNGNRTSLRPRQ
jgi:hypothetical protein